MIVIVDYGSGNLKSIKNMLVFLGVAAQISSDPEIIERSDKLILPGVGSFDSGMNNLRSSKLVSVLEAQVFQEKKPILGICLGMQLMTNSSEEGREPGLGWFDAKTTRFNFSSDENLKVPHMGWNFVNPVGYSRIFEDLNGPLSRFYFVHSYFVECFDKSNILAQCTYGTEFTCAINKGNIYGVQFHPEKSHKFGMKLLKNFAEL